MFPWLLLTIEQPHLYTEYIKLHTYNSFPSSKNIKLNEDGKAQIVSKYQLVEPNMFGDLTFYFCRSKYRYWKVSR